MTARCSSVRGEARRGGRCPWARPGVDGRVGRRVLQRLGLDVDLPVGRVAPAYRAFLPEAKEVGFWPFLREAFLNDRSVCRSASDEVDWLATHLRVARPDGTLRSWERRWCRAEELSGLVGRAPERLHLHARRTLLSYLAFQGRYEELVSDALASAMLAEVGQDR